MRVFVAGANGAVGRRLVPMLVARGHQVTGTTTSETVRSRRIRTLGAEPVVVDGLDAVGIGEAVARAEPDAIIHEMTALSGTPDFRHFDRWFALTNRLRTEGTEHLLAAAKASGVKRFVAQSFTGWSNSREGSWIKTEDDPLDPHPVKEQTETLAAIKFLERAVLEAPLEGIVVRYGGLYGPGSSETLGDILRKRMFPVIGNGAGIVSSTHIDDAAGGHARRPRARSARHLQHRRRRAGADPRVHPGDRRGARGAEAAADPGLARPAARGRRRGDDDDRGPRLVEREGEARARLAADLAELAGRLPPRPRHAGAAAAADADDDVDAPGRSSAA